MRLHTKLPYRQVFAAMEAVKNDGKVAKDVQFTAFSDHKSRTHPFAYEIQLGTHDRHSLPENYVDRQGRHRRTRNFKNSGDRGSASEWATGCDVYAATWEEWGWFMAELFALDPDARWGSVKGWHYAGVADFNAKTGNRFIPEDMLFPKGYTV